MEKIDLCKPYVAVGEYVIQEHVFAGVPQEVEPEGDDFAAQYRAKMKYIASRLGLIYDEYRSGEQHGYGHGRKTLLLANSDGTIIYKMVYVNHCEGPGYSCSYSHGPWYEYGQYKGPVPVNGDLALAIETKKRLEEKFRF